MIRRCNPQFCQTKRSFPLEACLSDGSQRSRHGPCRTGQTAAARATESYSSDLRSQRPQVKWSSVLDAKHRDGIQTETNLESMSRTVFISTLNFSSAPSGRGAITHPALPRQKRRTHRTATPHASSSLPSYGSVMLTNMRFAVATSCCATGTITASLFRLIMPSCVPIGPRPVQKYNTASIPSSTLGF